MTIATRLTIVGIGALNKRANACMPVVAKAIKGIVPYPIIKRMSREPHYAGGFTGFKAHSAAWTRAAHSDESPDDLLIQDGGLVGQFLAAIAATEDEAIGSGRRDPLRWRFYYADVPYSGQQEGRYEVGSAFFLPPEAERRRVIDWTDEELLNELRDGFIRLCNSIIAGEADRV